MGRNGYDSIQEETAPLNTDIDGASSASFSEKSSTKAVWVTGAIVVAVVALLAVHLRPSPPPLQLTTDASQVLIRPFCFTTSTNQKARILQTSMKEPSHQWAEQPCVQGASTNRINAFGAPDAILQVNFSQVAHPERDIPILGFGGAFTEAAARNFQRLTQPGQDAVLELLFGPQGLGYTLGRLHINSCDFSVQSYSFDEKKNDFDLNDFDMNVLHDVETGMVDMARRAISKVRASWTQSVGPKKDGEFLLYASPWSPPSWMKLPTWEDYKRNPNATTAHAMTYSAQPNCLKEGVGPHSRYARAWALYFAKYLTAYQNLGLPLQAVTVQNEPEFPAPWEACAYDPDSQRAFVANHLGPVLRELHPEVQIWVFDHNKDHVITWVDNLLNETSEAKEYISGTAYHWYAGGKLRWYFL